MRRVVSAIVFLLSTSSVALAADVTYVLETPGVV